jgi:peptidoglycan/xylan/chitin deacetylase (PgdA/CDA1 family)
MGHIFEDTSRKLTRRPQVWALALAVALGMWGGTIAVQAQPVTPTIVSPNKVAGAQVVAPPPVAPVNCAVQACLAVTFDDGPSTTITPQVLNILQKHRVRATFFVLGVHVKGNEPLLKRMYSEGHEIGNHSWGHPNLTTLTGQQVALQVGLTQRAITDAGVPAPTIFRPPYGAVNDMVRSHVPLTIALWNVDPEDWHSKKPFDIIDRVRTQAQAGRVILMHDTDQATADALDPLLYELGPHYKFVTFSEMFNLAPGQRGVFYGR